MKKRFFLLIISILAVISIISILYFLPKPSITVVTENYSLVDKQYLSKDTTLGTLTVDINIELPVDYKDKLMLDKIRTIVCSELFGNFKLIYPDDSLLYFFTEELKSEYVQNNLNFAEKISDDSQLVFNNSFILEGFSLLNDENIFSYGISRYVDFGGTHPAKTRFFYNFNLKNGTILQESDLFVEGYENELTGIIKNKIIEDSHNSEGIPYIDSFDNTEYILEAIKPNGNFYINDEAICYVFNPYEIAPINYIGETEVVLPYQLIKHLLKEGNPISYLLLTNQ
jgi:hypothetical protein